MNIIAILGHADSAKLITEMLVSLSVRVVHIQSLENLEKTLGTPDIACVVVDEDFFVQEEASRSRLFEMLNHLQKKFIVVSSRQDKKVVKQTVAQGAKAYITKPYNQREFIAHVNAIVMGKFNIVCLGGGTGLFTLLTGLKRIENVFLSSVVSMADDGGSSGRLRTSFGILPPGDIRRSLVALSNAPELMNHVIQHRFEEGDDLEGHNVGNLILTALTSMKGSMAEAVKALGDILNVQGLVIPITSAQTCLCADFEDGSTARGESLISECRDRDHQVRLKKLWIDPKAECDIAAYAAILTADLVTIGPGDLYTSVISNLLIGGVNDAIRDTKAKKLYLCNLMTKPGETSGYDAFEHVSEILNYLEGDYLDYVFLPNMKIPEQSKQYYAKKNQHPVHNDRLEELKKKTQADLILADVGHSDELVRHDSDKLKFEVESLLLKLQSARLKELGLL